MSENNFFKSKGNQLDIAILSFLVFILLFVCLFVPEDPSQDALEADDVLLLIIIFVRYSIQIGRLVCLIRDSHQSIFVQKNLNNIELNNLPRSQMHENRNGYPELQNSEIVKNAMVAMHSYPRLPIDEDMPTLRTESRV